MKTKIDIIDYTTVSLYNLLELQQGEVFMEEYFGIIKKCPLFIGVNDSELKVLLKCLSARNRCFEKNDFIFTEGEKSQLVGIVLHGSAYILQEDFWGNRTILARAETGHLFGEAFSCAEVEKLPISVVAAEKSNIMLIDCKRIITACSTACTFHSLLIQNMMRNLARKNILLTQKIESVTRRNTREKLLTYLSRQSIEAGSNCFVIPFNRQELADYLSVERSAMSAEISKMKAAGLIRTNKNEFELLI